MNISVVDVSSVVGLFALIILSVNFLLGMMLSTAYRRSVYWKRLPSKVQQLSVQQVHNWTAYVALALILVHPILLLFDKATKFFPADIFIPFHSSYQSFWVGMGVLSFYAVVIVILTTQKTIKRKLRFRLWKNIHLISYGTALLMCLHGLFLDPELKNRTPDFFDGEKLVCEICLLLLLGSTVLRIRYHGKRKNRQTA